MELVFCVQCGQKISSSDRICPHCGAQQSQAAFSASVQSQAATPPASALPEGVKGWSWGAFWLSWIWAIFNKTWIGLLALIPLVNLVVMVILGLKGREWAWRNKAWASVEEFKRVQMKWSIAGWIITILAFLAGIVGGVIEDRMKHRSNDESDANWSLDQDANKNSPSSNTSERSETPTPQANTPYPMPSMNFSKIDLLGAMNRAGMEQHWVAHYTKYLAEPEGFWQECVAGEASVAQINGGMNQIDAQSHGENVCQGVVQRHYSCLNNKTLDDAIMCVQAYIGDMAENGE